MKSNAIKKLSVLNAGKQLWVFALVSVQNVTLKNTKYQPLNAGSIFSSLFVDSILPGWTHIFPTRRHDFIQKHLKERSM